MPRGERRSLVTFDLGPGEDQLESLVQAEAEACAGALERLLGKRAPAWLQLPLALRDADLAELRDLAEELRANSDVLLVLGTPGLELSARGLVQALQPALPDQRPHLEFLGRDWAGAGRVSELLGWLGERRVSLAVLAGDGPSPLSAACFRVLRGHILRRHGPAETTRRIVVAATGGDDPLVGNARDLGLRVLESPVKLPEAYGALAPPGLLPCALSGLDPTHLVEGARSQARSMEGSPPATLPGVRYALARRILAGQGRDLELLGTGASPMAPLLGAWEHLFSLPEPGRLEAPLAMASRPERVQGPWLETEGPRAFGTWMEVPLPEGPAIPEDELGDGCPGLEGLDLGALQELLAETERSAWRENGLPVLELGISRLDALHVGSLLFFLQTVRGLCSGWPEAVPQARPREGLRGSRREGPPHDLPGGI